MQFQLIRSLIFTLTLPVLAVYCLAQPLDSLKIKAEADCLKAQADSLFEAHRYESALSLYQAALADYQLTGDKAAQASTYEGIGKTYFLMGMFKEEIASQEMRLDLAQELGDRGEEVESLNAIGDAYRFLMQGIKAESFFQKSRKIAQEMGDPALQAASLNALALAYTMNAKYDSGLILANQALGIYRRLGDKVGEIRTLYNLSEYYNAMRAFRKALEYAQESLAVCRELENRVYEAWGPREVGTRLVRVGDPVQALEYLLRALKIDTELGDSAALPFDYQVIARCYANLHQYNEALTNDQKALSIFQNLGRKYRICWCYHFIGETYLLLEEYDLALQNHQKGLTLARELNDPGAELLALQDIGIVQTRQKDFAQAEKNLRAALEIAQTFHLIDDWVWANYNLLGDCFSAQGLDSIAIVAYENSIRLVENARDQLTIESQKRGYAERVSQVYDGMVQSYLKISKPALAFHYAERARARSFLDLLASGRKVGKPRHQEFMASESKYLQEKQKVEAQIASAGDDTAQVALLRGMLTQEWEAALTGMEEQKRQEPELASLVSVNPLTLPEVQTLLNKDATLLEYFLTEKQTLLWTVTRNNLKVFQIPIGGDSLKTLVTAFRRAIEEKAPTEALSRRLYNLLIAPSVSQLKTRDLVIVPHGILHYLPFAALQDPQGRTLMDDHVIRYLPSASVLKYLPAKRHDRGNRLLALGNPATNRSGYRPLKQAQAEALQIGSLNPQSLALTGDKATEGAFKELAPYYDILHLACHGDLNSAYPLYSCLLLAPDSCEDGELAVHEIFNLDLNASLVVLSGCQTALGQMTSGDEVVGLSRAFIYAGTPSIVSSLWMVEDQSTAYLMERFYQHLKEMNKAEALRQAQVDTRQKYPLPRSWASFVFTGQAN